jgi:WD40 repeat protein
MTYFAAAASTEAETEDLLGIVRGNAVEVVNQAGRPLRVFVGHSSGVVGMAFLRDGTSFVTGARDGSVIRQVVDGSGGPVRLRGEGSPCTTLVASRDGTRVAAVFGDGEVHVWGWDKGYEPGSHSTNSLPMNVKASDVYLPEVSLASDMLMATVTTDGEVLLWRIDLKAPPTLPSSRPLRCGPGVKAVAFSPDGRYLVCGGSGRVVQLVHVPTCSIDSQFEARGAVTSVAFSPDGGRLAIGTGAGPVELLRIEPDPEKSRPPFVTARSGNKDHR